MRPTSPATIGVDIEVPLSKRSPGTCWPLMTTPAARTSQVEMMSTPGAATSTKSPLVENGAIESVASVAATAMTCWRAAGYCGMPRLVSDSWLLPEEATRTTPLAQA
jgi:hypothetical protein